MTKKPNFLFIMTDQQRADWLGCYGHPVLKTPNIDSIAENGTRFDQFYVATPVCMPNRASFMTGRNPSLHGLRYNGCLLPTRANTFVDVLREGGYKTATIGKSHLQPMTKMKATSHEPFETGPISEAWKPDNSDYEREAPTQFQDDNKFDLPTPYYGFDHVDVVTGHGSQAGGHYLQWLRERHPDWQDLVDPRNSLPHDYSCPQANRTPLPEDSYHTAYIRDRGIDYLRKRADDDTPFFAFVSFCDPHHPFNPPGKYWDMYSPDQFELSEGAENHKNPPPTLQALQADYDAGKFPNMRELPFMASDRHVRESMALTAGMISMIDDAVGKLIETLKETGQYENTVIVYNADHGDYMGDCNLMLKGPWARDSINRVPMIWSDPEDRTGGISQAMASTIDLSASIIERAGLKPYFGIQGKSFLNSVHTDAAHRDRIFIEFNDGLARMGFERPGRVRTLMSEDWRLTVYKGQDWGELYDRRNDPGNTRNLWDDAEYSQVLSRMMEELTYCLIDQMDESPRSTMMA